MCSLGYYRKSVQLAHEIFSSEPPHSTPNLAGQIRWNDEVTGRATMLVLIYVEISKHNSDY